MDSFYYLTIIWLCVYASIFLANKTRLTPVLFYLGMGALLANLHVLPAKPDSFIQHFSEFGIIVIMFALGFEENTSAFLKSVKRSWGIAFFAGVAPFSITYFLADLFWGDPKVSVMCALAMTSTAVSLTMLTLKNEGLHRTKAAKGILTSAIIEDISSLILVALLIPIAVGDAEVTLAGLSLIALKAIAFFVIVSLVGLWVFPHNPPKIIQKIPILGRFGIKHIFSFGDGEHTVLGVLLIAVLGGMLSHYFGFHPAVGAYMAGLIMREEYFHLLKQTDKSHYESTKTIIDNVAFIWIGPVFFVVLGTQIPFDWEMFVSVLPYIVAFTVGVFVVQVLSAAFAAYYTGGFNKEESVLIGFGMLGRAELCFVVLDIAYVEYHIITKEVFFTLMATAFWLNIAVPLTIRFWKPYLLHARK